MAKSNKRNPTSSPVMRTQVRSRRRTWWVAGITVFLGALLFWGARFWWAGHPTPELPVIDSRSLDPAVARVLTQSLEAVRAEPRSAQAWGTLGVVLHANDYLTEALTAYRHTEQLDPKNAQWPYLRGMLLLPQAAALEPLRDAAKLAPNEPMTRLRLGQVLADHGQKEEAAREYQALLRQHPGYHLARLGQAKLEVAEGKFAAATETLKPLLNDPNVGRESYTLLASALQRMDKSGPAKAALQIAESLPPPADWPDPYLAKLTPYLLGEQRLADQGKRLLEEGRMEQALTIINRALQEYPNSAEAWLLLGRAQLKQKNCGAAQNSLRRHLEILPQSVNGYSQLGIALLCLEQYGEAATALKQAVSLKPDFGQGHFNLGYALARQGQAGSAMRSFRDAIRCSPDFIDSYIILADLLGQSGERGEARRVLEQARALNPADARIQALAQRLSER